MLLSKSPSKKVKAHIDMENDKATVLDKESPLSIFASGHYSIDILSSLSCDKSTQEDIIQEIMISSGEYLVSTSS